MEWQDLIGVAVFGILFAMPSLIFIGVFCLQAGKDSKWANYLLEDNKSYRLFIAAYLAGMLIAYILINSDGGSGGGYDGARGVGPFEY